MSGSARPRPAPADSVLLGGPVVARIPYLNAEPFYTRWDELPGVSVDRVPRQLGEEARAGTVDAGLMAVVDYFASDSEFERLGSFGVSCRGAVESVLLLHAGEFAALSGGRVLLTAESSTSVWLCRLLLERYFGLGGLRFERRAFDESVVASSAPPRGEAWLVIGDAALAARRGRRPEEILDLGAAWTEWTDLPFVFAVWAVRRDLPVESKASLERFLDSSLALGERDLRALTSSYAERTEGRLGGAADLAAYLACFRYRLGPEDEAGLALFRERLGEVTP